MIQVRLGLLARITQIQEQKPDTIVLDENNEFFERQKSFFADFNIPMEVKRKLVLLLFQGELNRAVRGQITLEFQLPNLEDVIKDLQSEWREQNFEVGNDFGYPICCIDEFCKDHPLLLEHLPNTTERQNTEKLRYDMSLIDGEETGFFPCLSCAEKIKNGETTLEGLIDYKRRKPYLGKLYFNINPFNSIPVPKLLDIDPDLKPIITTPEIQPPTEAKKTTRKPTKKNK